MIIDTTVGTVNFTAGTTLNVRQLSSLLDLLMFGPAENSTPDEPAEPYVVLRVMVKSDSRAHVRHLVEFWSDGSITCDCEHYKYHGRDENLAPVPGFMCKHGTRERWSRVTELHDLCPATYF